jgi:hypothetical protein
VNNDENTKENILKHFGIIGMRWGRSNSGDSGSSKSKSSGSSKSKGKSSGSSKSKGKSSGSSKPVYNSKDHKRSKGLQKKKMSEMSNTELKKVSDRLTLERSYKKLTASKKSKGRVLFDDIIVASAKKTAVSYVSKQMSAQLGISDSKKKKG